MVDFILTGATLIYFFGLGILSIYLVEQERRPSEEESMTDDDIVPFLM
jgi:hypothetical protein